MNKPRPILLLCLLLLVISASADHLNDSLDALVEKANSDTQRLNVLYKIAADYARVDAEVSMKYARKLESESQRLGEQRYLGWSWFLIGNNYDDIQSYPDAAEYYYKALEVLEELKDTASLVKLYNQIGILFSYQKKPEEALVYFKKFADLIQGTNDEKLLANCYNNIGVTYKNLGRKDLANEFYVKALEIFKRMDFKRGVASCYLNIAIIRDLDSKKDEAISYNLKAISLFRETGNTFGLITGFINTADVLMSMEKLDLSKQYLDSANTLALAEDDKLHLRDIYDIYAKLYKRRGDYKRSLEYYEKWLNVRDSLFASENAQNAQNLEARHKMLKTEKELELLKKNEEIQDLHLTRSRIFTVLLILAVLSVASIAILLFQRNKAKQQANEALQQQKEEILHQKNEITDSINYARRIQESILPPDRVVKAVLPDSFVLYLPKDIVSGDFYWTDKKEGRSWFAAVDCTGHGVPGAMMSVLGFNLIQQSLHDKNLQTPGEILKNLDNGVNMTLRQSGSYDTVKDGMDLALCCIDWHKMELQYSGAYNSLWILKKDSVDILEIKADKKIIGSNVNDVADDFTNHRISLQRGDLIFLHSDGYADQFGGPKNKKFKYRPMKELLLKIRDKSMQEQHDILKQTLRDWQGDNEQVDDVLVIGVRV